jgi:MFS family permease
MLIPELPEFLSSLGGAEYKGLIISLFTLTAMASRPFSGKLTDMLGRKPVMMIGGIVCFVCSLLYPVLSTVSGFLLLRLLHGFSTGFSPTGVAAFITDTIPANKRGEAMGWVGTSGALGMAGGPAVSDFLVTNFGLNFVFYLSAFFAFASVFIMMQVKETLENRKGLTWHFLKIKKVDVYEPLVLAPAIVMLLTAFSYGTVFTLMPDFGKHVNISSKGLLFTAITIASLLIRLLAGRASDRYGRIAILKLSVPLMLGSMITIGAATSSIQLIIGCILYGFAQGATSPTLLAWTTDLCDEQHRGRGIAFFYIFMEMGIGLGAFASAWIYGNDPTQFLITFVVCASLCTIAFFYLMIKHRTRYAD